MPTAQIIFHQPTGDGYTNPGSRDDLLIYDGTSNTSITVNNVDNTGVTSWQWTIIDKPTGSTAVFASTSSNTSTASTDKFNPDIVGTYLIKLAVNGGASIDQKGAAVKTAHLHFRIPAANETIEFDGYRGWAVATNLALKLLDDGYTATTTSTFQAVYNNSSPSSFTLSSGNGPFQIRDTVGGLGTNLLEVDSSAGIKYLAVSAAQTSVIGNFTAISGQVGLGTATPFSGYPISSDGSVHVIKTGHNMLLVDTTTASSDAGIALFGQTSGKHAALFLDQSDAQKLKITTSSVDTHSQRQANTIVTIQQNGAVGIGTTAPTAQLDVVGTGHFSGQLSLTSGFSASADSTMNSFKLTSLATPVSSTDAANKSYVDAKVAASGNTLQAIYTASTPATTILSSANSAFVLTDAQSPLTSNLFEIDSYGGSSNFFTVSRAATKVKTQIGVTQSQTFPTAGASNALIAIWGSSPTNIYAGGTEGSGPASSPVYHSTGNGVWSAVSTWGGSGSDQVSGLWTDSTGRLYVAVNNGTNGMYITTNGGVTWTNPAAFSGLAVDCVWGADDTHVFAVAGSTFGNRHVYSSANNGSTWTQLTLIGDRANSMFGTSLVDIYIATGGSGSGAVWHSSDGASFTSVFTPSVVSQTGNMTGVWGVSGNVYAVGGSFIVYSSNSGGAWSLQKTLANPARSVFGSSANDVYVLSTDSSAGHTILHSTGNGIWFNVSDGGLSPGKIPYAIWGSSYNDFYVTIQDGGILHLTPQGGDLVVDGTISVGGKVISAAGASVGQALIYNGSYYAPQTVSALSGLVDGYIPSATSSTTLGNSGYFEDTLTIGVPDLLATGSIVAGIRSYGGANGIATAHTSYGDGYYGNGFNIALSGSQNPELEFRSSLGSPRRIKLAQGSTLTGDPREFQINCNPAGTDTGTLAVGDTAMHVSVPTIFTSTISVDGYLINPGFTAPANGQALAWSSAHNAFIPTTISGGGGSGTIVDTVDVQLTTTSPTTVLSYTPSMADNFVAYIYYRVITATTTLSIIITWTDSTGSQSYSLVPSSSQIVGSYNVVPIYFDSTASTITITATAGTSNQVYVSGSLVSLAIGGGVAERSNAFDLQLTTTSATGVVSYTPPINGNYLIHVYYRVANTTTNVTITLTWTDAAGAQTLTVVALTSTLVGSYTLSPIYIAAVTSAITLTATAGTANNVYVSSTIISV